MHTEIYKKKVELFLMDKPFQYIFVIQTFYTINTCAIFQTIYIQL